MSLINFQIVFHLTSQVIHYLLFDVDTRPRWGRTAAPDLGEESAAIQFGTVQLFVAIYLQKFALGSVSFQVSVPILIMLGHVAIMLSRGHMHFAPVRLMCYMAFAGCCFLSQAISGTQFSVPSIVELLLIYSFLTLTTYVSETAYQLLMKRFVAMMVNQRYETTRMICICIYLSPSGVLLVPTPCIYPKVQQASLGK